jgi:hypothetical protein
VQDGPTMELVLEIGQDAGTEMTLFVDDLVVELAPEGAEATEPTEPAQPAARADRPADYVAIDLPEPTAPAPEGEMETLPDGGTRWTWAFEASHPWNRIYPVPTESEAGTAVGGLAELSDEQAQSGTKSGKVLVQFPPAPPGGYEIKLFSARFQFFTKPIRRIAFSAYNDGAPISYRLRVRDGRGEGFWSAPRTLEGGGWRQIEWDLQADPPVTVRGGDDSGAQDGPPLEIIMEYQVEAGDGWTKRAIYVDDLVVELAP